MSSKGDISVKEIYGEKYLIRSLVVNTIAFNIAINSNINGLYNFNNNTTPTVNVIANNPYIRNIKSLTSNYTA